jgi:hypothetical protein
MEGEAMDPITLIVTALALGAAAGVQETAGQVVKDAYAGLKALVKRKYERVSVEVLENDPADETRQAIVKTDLEKAAARQDEELLRQAQSLILLVGQHAPESAAAIQINLKEAEVAASVRLEELVATGTKADVRVDAEKAKVGGDFEMKGVRASGGGNPEPKK